MLDDKSDDNQLPSSEVVSSNDLMYSEYANSSVVEHVVELLKNKDKTKPKMLFEKSSVMNRCSMLLESLEKSQNDLNEKSPEEYNIEAVDAGESFVNMDVAVVNPLADDADEPGLDTGDLEFIETSSKSSLDSDSEESEDESEDNKSVSSTAEIGSDDDNEFELFEDIESVSSHNDEKYDKKSKCILKENKRSEIGSDDDDDDEFELYEDTESVSSHDDKKYDKKSKCILKGNKRGLITVIEDKTIESMHEEQSQKKLRGK